MSFAPKQFALRGTRLLPSLYVEYWDRSLKHTHEASPGTGTGGAGEGGKGEGTGSVALGFLPMNGPSIRTRSAYGALWPPWYRQ
eukprot:1198350-Prymnesium_polylepis.2